MQHGPPPETDAEILAASLMDPDTFGLIYDRHVKDIHRFAARRLGWSTADDLTADVFLAAFRSRHRFDHRAGNARAWLYGIANNLIRKHRRDEVRALKTLARTGSDPLTPRSTNPVTRSPAAQSLEAPLASALAALAARDRDVLLLIAWAELTYDEVARALQIPVGTVRSRLNRARGQVQRSLRTAAADHPTLPDAVHVSPTRTREAI